MRSSSNRWLTHRGMMPASGSCRESKGVGETMTGGREGEGESEGRGNGETVRRYKVVHFLWAMNEVECDNGWGGEGVGVVMRWNQESIFFNSRGSSKRAKTIARGELTSFVQFFSTGKNPPWGEHNEQTWECLVKDYEEECEEGRMYYLYISSSYHFVTLSSYLHLSVMPYYPFPFPYLLNHPPITINSPCHPLNHLNYHMPLHTHSISLPLPIPFRLPFPLLITPWPPPHHPYLLPGGWVWHALPLHGEGLARACLSIGEDGAVEPTQDLLHRVLGHCFVHINLEKRKR